MNHWKELSGSFSVPLHSRRDWIAVKRVSLQLPVDYLEGEWRLLWRDRIEDKVLAESIANRDYSLLFVERGTVIIATRDFKPLSFKEILSSHVQNAEQFVPPRPSVGGWGKFARTVLNKQKRFRKCNVEKTVPHRKRKRIQQLKKGGMGWLYYRIER